MPCALAHFQWRNFHRNSNISIYEKAFENVVSWMAVIMLMLYTVNGCLTSMNIAPVYTCGNNFPNGLRAYRVWRLWGQSSSELFCNGRGFVAKRERCCKSNVCLWFLLYSPSECQWQVHIQHVCRIAAGWFSIRSELAVGRWGKYRHGEVFILIKGNETLFTFAYLVNFVC